MAAPSLPTVPEVQYENMSGEQLAADLAVLTGQTVEEVKSAGVQTALVSLHLTEKLPEGREDLVRLATGESFVRPTVFTRVTPDTASVLVVEAEIGTDDPAESQNGNIAIDVAIGIRPRPATVPSVAATASTATGKGIGKNGTPVAALHLMNETLVHNRLSRNGPVSPTGRVCHD